MNRDTFVDTLMKRLGNNNDTTLRDSIIAEMVLVQSDVLEQDVFWPWFLITEMASSETIVGDERVQLPVDFIMPWEEGFLYRYDASLADPYVEMAREDWSDIKTALNYSDTPTHYDLAGDYILMRPLSDEIYPLRMRYIARGLDLSGTYGDANNIENVWLANASDWFLGEVGQIIADNYLQMPAKTVQRFEKQALKARSRIMLKNIAMQELMKTRIIGG